MCVRVCVYERHSMNKGNLISYLFINLFSFLFNIFSGFSFININSTLELVL